MARQFDFAKLPYNPLVTKISITIISDTFLMLARICTHPILHSFCGCFLLPLLGFQWETPHSQLPVYRQNSREKQLLIWLQADFYIRTIGLISMTLEWSSSAVESICFKQVIDVLFITLSIISLLNEIQMSLKKTTFPANKGIMQMVTRFN